MTVFLRFVGTLNAAIWLGAAVFFTFVVGPGVFSQDVRQLFGEPGFKFFAGGVALTLIKRYFVLQNICGVIALLHLQAEKLYLGRRASRWFLFMLTTMLVIGLWGSFWLQPKMTGLRQIKYSQTATQDSKDRASHSFDVWHGVSMSINLLVMAGLVGYLIRVTRPPDTGRYSTFSKFRG